jgi:hypothetical protein
MPNTALNRTGVVFLTNKSGGSVAQGDTVIMDTTADASFTTTTTGALSTKLVGVVVEQNGIANNAVGAVAFSGYVPKTNLSASASRGDFLKTHTAAKQAVPHASPQVEGDFAEVLGTGTTPAAWLFGPNPPSGAYTPPNGTILQVVNTQTGAVATGTGTIPIDDTIPQNTEGDQYMSLAITPTSATSNLKIEVVWNGTNSGGSHTLTVALFQDTTANALAASSQFGGAGGGLEQVTFTHYMAAGTTSATTFKVRAGAAAGTTTFNGAGGARYLGGVYASSITITELKA